MEGVVVYGSLLATDALADVFGEDAHYTPVKVFGWRRCFNQRAAYRSSECGAEGVLNAVRDASSWFNGILVTNLSEEAFERYRERESGYELEVVPGDSVKPYGADYFDSEDEYWVASGRRFMENPRPIPAYAVECLDGAREWGDEFLADFLLETYRE